MATYIGTAGNDTLTGTAGADIFVGSLGSDTIVTGGGYDLLDYSALTYNGVPVTIVFNTNANTIAKYYNGTLIGTDTAPSIDTIRAGSGNDYLTGRDSTLYTGNGSSTAGINLDAGLGTNTIDGRGLGTNVADFRSIAGSITINLTAGTATAAGMSDTLINVRKVWGNNAGDTVLGSAGNDSFVLGSGANIVDGAGGTNLVVYSYVGAAISVDMSQASNQVSHNGVYDTLSNIQTFVATSYNDVLRGSAVNESFFGLAGNNTIIGGGGSDWVKYDNFFDGTYGAGTHGATVNLTTGTATNPWDGTDTLTAIQHVEGSQFADDLTGRSGSNYSYLRGMQGNDTLRAPSASNYATADYISDPAGVTVNLTTGSATDGWGYTDTLVNIHVVRGSAYNDILVGSATGDTFIGSLGSDSVDGGDTTNRNTMDYRNTQYSGTSVSVTFTAPGTATVTKAEGGTDTLTNINQVLGTNGNDTLIGYAGSSFLSLRLRGEAGNDTINGQNSTNITVDYQDSPNAVTVDLAAGTASDGWGTTDTLIGVVRVQGTSYNDTLLGSAGNDVFQVVSSGAHTIDGRGGLNTVVYQSSDNITIDLAAGTIVKTGGVTDTLANITRAYASGGNDTVYGSAGDDILGGGAGNNTIDGRGGYNYVGYVYFAGGEDTPTHGVTVDLSHQTATNMWGGTDALANIQGVAGSTFADDMTGIDLGATRSMLQGRQGNDILRAPDDHSLVTADYVNDPAGVAVNLPNGQAIDGWGGLDTLVSIHSVRGSGYADIIVGDGKPDLIEGGAGNDYIDGGAGLDTAIINATRASATLTHNADNSWTVSSSDGTDTLAHVERLRFSDATVAIGQAAPGDSDANGTSDLLLRNDAGPIVLWQMAGNAVTGGGLVASLDASWSLRGTGDFNGSGQASILLQNANGTLGLWDLNGSQLTGGGAIGTVGSDWSIRGLYDFDGDGRTDILLQNTAGAAVVWDMNGSQIAGGGLVGTVGSDWSVRGVGDFDGDGKGGILWQNTAGAVVVWDLNGSQLTGGGLVGTVGSDWSVRGVGDFDGDGKGGILWQNTAGAVVVWDLNGSQLTGGGLVGTVGSDWSVRGVGDFDGDGKGGILWQNTAGAVVVWDLNGSQLTGGGLVGTVGSDWSVRGVGDFDGDGRSDILWRNNDGTLLIWEMQDTQVAGGGLVATLDSSWDVEKIGDYNGDGRSDIELRNSNGALVVWEMNGTQVIGGGQVASLDTSWHLV
ncbi:hypothetical protein M0638_07910 [Roseomonas sp. NAR14]|uniref:Uncharacterized protein n=1 Tax=Roseomonas acroporae TaxID=2937791 RepID=A0A9X2BUN2_9PROT|nr:VCBS repeat-containing protein [Roseomonas acroporae]MCK8784301.1 hypothetical protein [Roseomonas acroporae]